MRLALSLALVFLFLAAHRNLDAEDVDKGRIPFEADGLITGQAQAREAPPYGPFNLFIGKKILRLDKGTEVKIIGKKTYSGFEGTHTWYAIEPLTTGKEPAGPLWLYGGVEGEQSAIQLRATK
jgi:hypothetical protein